MADSLAQPFTIERSREHSSSLMPSPRADHSSASAHWRGFPGMLIWW